MSAISSIGRFCRQVVPAIACCLAACGGGGGGGGADGGGGGGSGTPPPAPFGLDVRSAPSLAFPDQSAQGSEVQAVRTYPGLGFDAPLDVMAAPGDGTRLFVAQQGGLVRVFTRNQNVSSAQTFLDLRDRTRASGEQGLLGMAFDPGYAGNGFVYAHYNANANPNTATGDTVIARYTADVAAVRVNPASERVLLRFTQPFNNHNGGAIAFGPDGMLYIASGDGGSGGDPQNNAQNLNRLLGKILRIRPDGGIPSDNPFVGQSGARGEIWAYGLRNPFRMSFDFATSRLWAGDVGQNEFEEIDLIVRGGNYGWRRFEGFNDFNRSDPTPANAIAPIHAYDHSQGQSVTGGRVYRGTALPALTGRYVYGDFVSGRLWALSESGGVRTANDEIGQVNNPSSFGADVDGELLITSYDGGLYRLIAASSGGGDFPQTLSATGIFSDLSSLTVSPGLVEYRPNAEFWSDGTVKRRWLAVPGNARIGFSAGQAWTFPTGTVLVKHFEIDLANGTRRRLETRVLINSASGWQGYTYRWNGAGTEASLLAGSATTSFVAADAAAPGGTRNQTYEFPDRAACLQCHTAASGVILGAQTSQLNGTLTYRNGVSDNQLRALDHVDYFDQRLAAPSTYAALPDPFGATASLAQRARAYLETNCAQCHRPGGPTPVNMDLRFDRSTAQLNTHNVPPSGDSFGVADARRIVPGASARSLVWTRMNTLDGAARMPPLASHVVDREGVALVGAWIDAGAP